MSFELPIFPSVVVVVAILHVSKGLPSGQG